MSLKLDLILKDRYGIALSMSKDISAYKRSKMISCYCQNYRDELRGAEKGCHPRTEIQGDGVVGTVNIGEIVSPVSDAEDIRLTAIHKDVQIDVHRGHLEII
jgi:hypothetical protein